MGQDGLLAPVSCGYDAIQLSSPTAVCELHKNDRFFSGTILLDFSPSLHHQKSCGQALSHLDNRWIYPSSPHPFVPTTATSASSQGTGATWRQL